MERERPVQSPHQIHISRIYFIGWQIGSLTKGRTPHRPSAAPVLRMEASMSKNGSGIESKNGSGIELKNGSGIELKNGIGIEPSDIAARQIVPHDASGGVTFEEQLDRHAKTIARYGTEWAARLVEEADRLVEEAEAKRRAAVEFAEEIKRRASETADDLKAGFERIRAAGRALQDARRQFDLGRGS